MYTPSFTEVFVGYTAVLFWSAWLGRKGHWPLGMQFGPIALGLALLAALAVSTQAMIASSTGAIDVRPIELSRWVSVGLVALGLGVDAAFTARHFLRPPPPPPAP